LLSLRESQPLVVYATETVRRGFVHGNALYQTLERFPGQVTWRALVPGRTHTLTLPDGRASGLTLEPIPVPGQPPLHLRGMLSPSAEDNVGLMLRDLGTRSTLSYLSGVAAMSATVRAAVAGAQCLFFDGTFWSSDELIALGLSDRRAEDMAHWPIGGPHGSLRALTELARGRRIFIHVNNTNPILREDSSERAQLLAAGWEVAHDGLEFEL